MCIYIQSGLIVGSIKKALHESEVREGGVELKTVKASLQFLVEGMAIRGFTRLESRILPVRLSYTGVKYKTWVKKRVSSLKCTKAKSPGSKHMARIRPGEVGGAVWRIHTPRLSRAVASGLEHKLHPSTSNLDNSVIILSLRVFPG